VLTANVWAAAGQSASPRVTVFDAAGQPIAAEVLANDSGTYTVQAPGLTAGSDYFLRVAGGAGPGNYLLTADFDSVLTEVRTFADGEVSATSSRTDTLYIGQTQLFHLSLSVDAAPVPSGTGVQMTVTDETGAVVLSLTAGAGETVTGAAVLLRPGEYEVRYTVVGPGVPDATLLFRVRGNRITDPVGPVADDVTQTPEYRDPNDPNRFRYPTGVISLDPFFWYSIL
jgi:hypothetical protein